jgi:hypothetical protein
VYEDGSQVEPPIAVCEIQGYYFAALQSAPGSYSRSSAFARLTSEVTNAHIYSDGRPQPERA